MDIHKFIELETELINSALNISKSKRPAYTGNSNDVLKNFKSAAEAAGVAPLQAWAVLAKKHLDALLSFAKDQGIEQAEPLWGRASDAINYIVLGMALAIDLGLTEDPTVDKNEAYVAAKPPDQEERTRKIHEAFAKPEHPTYPTVTVCPTGYVPRPTCKPGSTTP